MQLILSFLHSLATGIGYFVIFASVLIVLALVTALSVGCWLNRPPPARPLKFDLERLDPDFEPPLPRWDPSTGAREREFIEPETDAVIEGAEGLTAQLPPNPSAYSDLPPAWIPPAHGDDQGAAWVPTSLEQIEHNEIVAEAIRRRAQRGINGHAHPASASVPTPAA